jgi:hypothetical protein
VTKSRRQTFDIPNIRGVGRGVNTFGQVATKKKAGFQTGPSMSHDTMCLGDSFNNQLANSFSSPFDAITPPIIVDLCQQFGIGIEINEYPIILLGGGCRGRIFTYKRKFLNHNIYALAQGERPMSLRLLAEQFRLSVIYRIALMIIKGL